MSKRYKPTKFDKWLLAILMTISLIIVFIFGIPYATANDKIFNKCKACHSFDVNRKTIGPHLVGIVGREMAGVEGYKYSKAMLDYQGFVWDEVNLGIWLQNPKKMIPKTKMIFPGLKKPDQLDALIEYLKTK